NYYLESAKLAVNCVFDDLRFCYFPCGILLVEMRFIFSSLRDLINQVVVCVAEQLTRFSANP
ncbi:MAG: hypothetical protein K2G68_00950, partial [Helicobacter sp.]|nr:hypothetical protein [Helicobacter sp.]